MRHEDARSSELESEELLNSKEIRTVHFDYEIAGGYIARFLGKFKRFKAMNHGHPRVLLSRFQRRRNCQFREAFESEFGIEIPPKFSSRGQMRLSDSESENERCDTNVNSKLKDGVVREIDFDLESHSESGSEPNDNGTDCELEDGILNDIDKDLWNLLGDFSEALYTRCRIGPPVCKYLAGWQHHHCACTIEFHCDVCKILLYVGMSNNFLWKRTLYGHGRESILRLHCRHKQCLRDRGELSLLRQVISKDAGPELVHEYEVAGASTCHNHTLVLATRRHFCEKPKRLMC